MDLITSRPQPFGRMGKRHRNYEPEYQGPAQKNFTFWHLIFTPERQFREFIFARTLRIPRSLETHSRPFFLRYCLQVTAILSGLSMAGSGTL